jgi:adenylate cyclase
MAILRILGRNERDHALGWTTTVGRDAGCEICLADPLVSRAHAEVRRTPDGRYRIVDLNSSHGTFVQGQRISEYLLEPQDEVLVGTTRLVFLEAENELVSPPQVDEDAGQAVVETEVSVEPATSRFPPAEEVGDVEKLMIGYEKLRAAYAITSNMRLTGGLDELLESIVDTAIDLLSADRAAILLVDQTTGRLETRIAKHRDGKRAAMRFSRSILNRVTGQKVGVISADAGTDARFGRAASILASGIRSAMCVPMLHREEVLGVIHIDTLMATNLFRESDLALFNAIANQAAVVVRNVMLADRLKEEARTRITLQRFLSPTVSDEIIRGQLRIGQRGELRPITVFFMDIRGFTRMSEHMEPAAVVRLLNAFFDTMVDVLFKHRGALDKYVGDELMALFGAPIELPDAPFAAVSCALEMLAALEAFNERQQEAGEPTVKVGIGIHTGPALCGAIGSSRTKQYTAIGDTVNTAARLCAVARPEGIVVSRSTWDAVSGRVEAEALPPVEVKGKSQPLETYRVLRASG